MLLSLSYSDFENAFSSVLLWCLNKIADLLNQVLGFLPDDPHFFKQLDFSSIQKYINFIHYFIPLKFIFRLKESGVPPEGNLRIFPYARTELSTVTLAYAPQS